MPYSGVQVTALSPLGVGWARPPTLTLTLGPYNTTTTTTTTTTSTTSTSTSTTSTSTTSSTSSTTSPPPIGDGDFDLTTTRTLTTPVNTPPPPYYAGWPGGGADTSTYPFCYGATARYYLKFFPQWNDNRGSHGDDQINDGEVEVAQQVLSGQMADGVIPLDLVGVLAATQSELIADAESYSSSSPTILEPHYTPMNIIGNAIESYGGYKTVQVFKGDILLYSERKIELLKYIEWGFGCELTTEEITFRLRTEIGSSYFKDYKAYIRQVWQRGNCP